MRNAFLIVLAAGILIAFGVNMTTYQVDFTERAVVATFGKVSEESGVVDEPGLKFKWPAPIQTVTIYDSRARVLEVTGQQLSTADDASLIVDAFLTWKVSDPRSFSRRFSRGSGDPTGQYDAAAELLEGRLRQALSELSSFSLDQLFTTGGGSALPDLESRVLERVRRLVAEETGGDAGIEVGTAGISRLVFPESVASQVIDRMRAFREADSERARSEGAAEAATLSEDAQAKADSILDFARARAEEIRAQGEERAAEWYEIMNESPELATFLARQDMLTNRGLGRTLTLVLPSTQIGADFFDLQYLRSLVEDTMRNPPDIDRILGDDASTEGGR